uniref:Uncharacterized protein n=1 Tax=Opuntia streptacantha TaxID=393608 RepID=A0A7C8Z298_OPUST
MSNWFFSSDFLQVPYPCSDAYSSGHRCHRHRSCDCAGVSTVYCALMIFAISGDIPLLTQAQEVLVPSFKPTSAAPLGTVLAPEAPGGDRDIEVHPDPILRDLIIGPAGP